MALHPLDIPSPSTRYPFRQLEPQWAFELVITGISRYDHEIVYALDQYLHHTFVDAENKTLLQSTRTHDDYYCFTMRDWQATKEVILKAESIEGHFAQQKLSKPTLVYHITWAARLLRNGAHRMKLKRLQVNWVLKLTRCGRT